MSWRGVRRALHRLRRSWLVTPTCDARRITAASVGGRVSCVSAAALLGLWDVKDPVTHVALAPSASRYDPSEVKIHRAQGPIPTHTRASEEPLLNVLFQVARCAAPADALAVWESAIKRDFITRDELTQVEWRSTRARELSRTAGNGSDSGPESRFRVLMREIGVQIRQQVWVDGHPLDAVVGERLGVQLDGFAHHSAAKDRRRDIRGDARLVLRGYTVLRFDYQQVMHDPIYVQQTILTAVAQRLHLP